MRYLIFILFILFTGNASQAQKIPRIKKQPQWAMPFYFEDANGEKDTVWIGFDPEVTSGLAGFEEDFEIWRHLDTSKFGAFLFMTSTGNPKDSAKKIEILGGLENNKIRINFINGKMPVIMKWEDSLFYSSRLPIKEFPDISPRPRARADMVCINYENSGDCYVGTPHEPIVLTNYKPGEFRESASDSFLFNGSGKYSAQGSLSVKLTINPYNAPYWALKERHQGGFKIYPNPADKLIIIEGLDLNEFSYEIFSLSGKLFLQGENKLGFGKMMVKINSLPSGLYLLKIKTDLGLLNESFFKN